MCNRIIRKNIIFATNSRYMVLTEDISAAVLVYMWQLVGHTKALSVTFIKHEKARNTV